MLRSLLLLAFELMCTIFSVFHKDGGNGSLSLFFLSFFKSPFHSVLKTKGKELPRSDKNKERDPSKPTDAMFFVGKERLTFYSQQLQLGKRLISNFTFVFLTISFSLYLFCYYDSIEVGVLVNVDRFYSKNNVPYFIRITNF
jgi:hypothetical protein